MSSKEPEPLFYERQPGETARAYQAFAHYRDSGATRSLRRTRQDLDASWTTLSEWSSKHLWVSRAEAYDAEQDRRRRIEREEAAEAARDRAIKGAQLVQSIALKGLQQVIGGRINKGEIVEAEENPPMALLRYWREGVEMEFVALGLPINVIREQVESPDSEQVKAQRKAENYRHASQVFGW